MNDERTTERDDAKFDVLADFIDEVQASAKPEAIVRSYVQRYPAWRSDFLQEAVLCRAFSFTRARIAFPDLSELTDFRIIRHVATGGMGVVYEAEQQSLQRRVALKVRYGHSSPEREERFRQEQRVLAQLHQSHIVPIYYAGTTKQWQYFVMSFIEGVTLAQLLNTVREHVQQQRPLPSLIELVREAQRHSSGGVDTERVTQYAAELAGTLPTTTPTKELAPTALPTHYVTDVVRILGEIAASMEHAHQVGIIHRDIKPSNILVDTKGQGWLIDFGLADYAEPVSEIPADVPARLAGTPGYLAPEQLEPNLAAGIVSTVSVQTDIWSLGVTLFEMLTLRRPFEGTTPDEVRVNTISQPLPAMRQFVPNLPAELVAICGKALHKDPRERYPSAQSLADDLQRWRQGLPTVALPLSTWRAVWLWCGRHRGWATALALSVLLLISLTALLLLDAKARVKRAELEREAAQERSRHEQELLRLQKREGWLLDMEHRDRAHRFNGWSTQAFRLAQQASEVHRDASLRDRYATTLQGWDARVLHEYTFAATHFARDPHGQRMLFSGLLDLKGQPQFPNSLLDIGSQQRRTFASTDQGPVAFAADGMAVQLRHHADAVSVYNLDGDTVRATWKLPVPPQITLDPQNVLLALSADARYVSAAVTWEPNEGAVWVWEVASRRLLLHKAEPVEALAFGPSDLFAYVEARPRQIVVHSLAQAKTIAELPKGALPIHCLAFGKNVHRAEGAKEAPLPLLAAGDAGGLVTVWNTATRKVVSFCRARQRDVYAIAFNRDGTVLAAGGRGPLYLFDVPTGQMQLMIAPAVGIDYITAVAFMENDERLIVSSRGVFYRPQTSIWQLERHRGWRTYAGLTGPIEKVIISPDQKTIAALSQHWEIGLWDVASGERRATIEAPVGIYTDNADLVFSRDSQRLVFSASTITQTHVRLYDTQEGYEQQRWTLPPGLQNKMAFTTEGSLLHFQAEAPSAKRLPTTDVPRDLHPRVGVVRQLRAMEPPVILQNITAFRSHIYDAQFSPEGKHLALAGMNDPTKPILLLLCDPHTAQEHWRHEYPPHATPGHFGFDQQGTSLFFNDHDPTQSTHATQLSLTNYHAVRTFDRLPMPLHLGSGYSTQGNHEGRVGCFLYHQHGGEPILNTTLVNSMLCGNFSDDGQWFAMGERDGGVSVLHLPTMNAKLQVLGVGWVADR